MILWDEETQTLSSGTLTVNVLDFTTKDQTLYCHFIEAMALDYNTSDYPKKHVCPGDKVPTEGKNAPKYKTISATLTKPASTNSTTLSMKWLIRNTQKELQIPVHLEWDKKKENLKLSSQWKMQRSDFGIIVKKFLFIEAENNLKINLEMNLSFSN
jgi:polyisoprenoid-binding protein YceI